MVATEPLPTEVEASYSAIIDEILRASDINTISAKRIRNALSDRLGYDISKHKVRSMLGARWTNLYPNVPF